MKLFICLLALSLVSATICAPAKVTKRGTGYGSGYSSAPMVETLVTPTRLPVQTPSIRSEVVQLETVRSDYGTPARTLVRETPVIEQVRTFESVPSSYGTPVRTLVRDNLITEQVRQLEPEYQRLCLDKKGYASVFYLPHPTRQSWYIQCDEHGQGFLKECPAGTIFTLNLVCENINDLHVVEEKRTVVQPQMDTVVGSYNTAPVFAADTTNSIETTRVEVIHEAPEFQELCLSKRSRSAYGSAATVFYLPHPNKQSWYIQCDEQGRAFLKDCPAGTIFTLNLVCEKIGELHTVEQTQTVVQPQMDTVVSKSYDSVPMTSSYSSSSYAAAPSLTLDAPAFTETIVQENPEFRELCLTKRTSGVAVFYLPHPNRQSWYIQCDEFGRSFLKECPSGTIFTLNLACENINDLHAIEQTQTVVQPQLDTVVGSYNTAPVFANDNSMIQTTVTIQEAPEFRDLCLTKRASGVAVFYLPHPSRQSWYIQCDEFGKAFLKECPSGTIFTLNLVCENINDLHAIEQTQTVVQPQLDTPVTGSYNAAPSFPVESSAVVETSRVEVIQEAPEFRELCASKRISGVAVFYLPHPTKQSWYIQCDEFGRAFLKDCPAGTIFTSRLTCEKIGEIREVETIVERPIVREQIISQPVLSYGERHVERPVLKEVQTTSSYQSTPILREQVIRPVAPVLPVKPLITRIERPIFREVPVSSYGYGQSRPILREQVIRPVAPVLPVKPVMTRIERPIMREVHTSSYQSTPVMRDVPVSSYGYGQSRPVLREQVIRPVTQFVQRPILREVMTARTSSY